MPPLSSRVSLEPGKPYRSVRPGTSKIIFLSCEGSVTEEEYIEIVSKVFDHVKTRIQLISVREDLLNISPEQRSPEQKNELTKSQPIQLVERIDQFIEEKEAVFEFSKHQDDEFWIIADVDHHTRPQLLDRWNEVITSCEQKHYGYAVSNPNFELWLLLHHTDCTQEDSLYAVTQQHPYERTNHFRERLRTAGAPLSKKHIDKTHYNREKIEAAVQRAKSLHNPEEKWPQDLGTTVYRLLEKIMETEVLSRS